MPAFPVNIVFRNRHRKMSALEDNMLNLQEQICYVQCGCCSTILLVNVPCSNLSMVVTVRCGHCTSILSVNMSKACLVQRHFFSSPNQQEDMAQPKSELTSEEAVADLQSSNTCFPLLHFSSDEDENKDSVHPDEVIIHKPPERKQRPPSAYNRFIKDEIKRLKIEHPNMTHKQAFSAAAKNWAHCPQSQHKGGDAKRAMHRDANSEEHHFGNGFEGKKSR